MSSGTTSGQTGTTGGPAHITVQHILIGFQGACPSKEITRPKEEAKTLAYDLLEQAKSGADFDPTGHKNTDDQAPGIYTMFQHRGHAAQRRRVPPRGMVPAFGNVGFTLQPGGIGIADYDPTTSPFGWHIIKRLPMADPPTAVPPSTGRCPRP